VNPLELTGRARTHVVALPAAAATLHLHAAAPFANLQREARTAGFDLKAVSSFRDFDRQLKIWNSKFTGERTLLDAAGRPLEVAALSAPERVEAILQWSALPGASRHHWGTDVDLIDATAVGADYDVRLTAEEFAPGGPFERMTRWLEDHAARFGFFRPFRGVLSGVRAEPWHYSFAPLAEIARRALNVAVLRGALEQAPLLGKDSVMERIDELHARFVAAIDWP